MLSGEAIPVDKAPGAEVSGGTLNLNGVLEIKVTASGETSVLGKIIKLVSEAQSSRPPVAKLANKVSGVFTWIIFAAAAITAALGEYKENMEEKNQDNSKVNRPHYQRRKNYQKKFLQKEHK